MQRGSDTFDLVEVPAPNEATLQEVMKMNPQLLPADDLGFDHDLVVVGRETVLASGQIDLLLLASTGDLVLVEFKTGPQNPDFRHALAQVIDYGSDLWGKSVDELDHGVVQRYLAGRYCDPAMKGAADLAGVVDRSGWELDDADKDVLRQRLQDVLTTGDFVFVVAAQRFTPGMTSSVDYLNSTMRHGRFHLVEMVRLDGNDLVAHAAQVVASPRPAGRHAPTTVSRANRDDFLAGIASDDYREAMRDVFDTAAALGLTVYWGSKGASLRLPTGDRPEPLSIGWAFLEGDQWNGATHLTLGVGRDSLASTPSAAAAVDRYVAQVRSLFGARPVTSRLDAVTFSPEVVPRVKAEVIQALEALVSAVNGDDDGEPAATSELP